MPVSLLNNIFFYNSFYFNVTSFIFFLIIPILIFLKRHFEVNKINFFESLMLFGFVIIFIIPIIFSHDLIIIYLLLEAVSFVLYATLGIQYDNIDRTDGIIKYFLINTLASIVILFGISLLFNIVSETNYIKYSLSSPETQPVIAVSIVFILLGIFFKIGSFPFSIWTVDVYEAIPFVFTVILLTVVKVSYLMLLFNFLYETLFINIVTLKWIIFASGVSSILIGCFGSLMQKKLKRFIAYTTINQLGFILLGFSSGTTEGFIVSFIYILIYTLLNINFFFLIVFLKSSTTPRGVVYLTDFASLIKSHFKSIFNFILILFAYAGLPPLVGFFIKYFLFANLFEVYTNTIFFIGIVISLLTSLISTFYYLRFIKIILFDNSTYKNLAIDNNFSIFNIKLFFVTIILNFYFWFTHHVVRFLVYKFKVNAINTYLNLFILISIICFSSFIFFYPCTAFISLLYKNFLLI